MTEGAHRPDDDFLIVGIGASAGAVAALGALLENVPPDIGCAFVVVPHLDPSQPSHMVEVLSPRTAMPVAEAGDGAVLEPGRVYVIPPDRYLTVENGVLHLSKPAEPRGHRRPIDLFFRSLAGGARNRAVAIVLSGTGTNGAAGLRAVKGEGGVVIVQRPDSTEFTGMPNAAIATGEADHVLTPGEMADVLKELCEHPYTRPAPADEAAGQDAAADPDEAPFQDVLSLLRVRAGRDFRAYRRSTLTRRIQRRMALSRVDTMKDYLDRLRTDPDELSTLANDLLITVTAFFRDPEAWQALEKAVIAPLVRDHETEEPVRIWVPGCATGEEAYSIAMLLIERCERERKKLDLRIFATDANEEALSVARDGIYAAEVVADVPRNRAERFFVRHGETVQVRKELRESIIFAPQDLLRDPPYSRLDLVSCRNVLMYLEPVIQRRLTALFHFALNEEGHLFLGTAESVSGQQEHLLEPVSKKWRIYRRLGPTRHDIIDFPIIESDPLRTPPLPVAEHRGRPRSAADIARETLLRSFAPAAVLVDKGFRVLYFHGDTEKFLRQPSGEPTNDLLTLARDGLRSTVRALVQDAAKTAAPATASVRFREGGEELRNLRLTALPQSGEHEGEILVLLCFGDETPKPEPEPDTAEPSGGEEDSEREVRALREELRSTLEQMESSNEELKASNEEIMSMNEELRSANEELETSKEELQSLNEELNTVNAQLETKVEQLETQTNDLNNLLNGTDVASLFLDRRFNIRWVTPAMRSLVSVQPSDVGRPVNDFAHRFERNDLRAAAERVLGTLAPASDEMRTEDGRWLLRRILPYRTEDDRIEGVVMHFSDVTGLKTLQQALERQRDYADRIVATVRQPLIVLSADLTVQRVNDGFCRTFRVSAEESVGKLVYDLGNGQWNIPRLRELLDDVLPDNEGFDDFEVEHEFPEIGYRAMLLNARRLADVQLILLGIEDVTESKRDKDRRELLVQELNHRVKNSLMTVQSIATQSLRAQGGLRGFRDAFFGRLQALASVHEILVSSGWESADLRTLVEKMIAPYEDGGRFTVACPDFRIRAAAVMPLTLVLHELITNAAKYGALSAPKGTVEVGCRNSDDGHAVITWRESGGPKVEEPTRVGFGSALIGRSMEHELGGEAVIDYRPDGVECILRFPVAYLEKDGGRGP